MTEKTKVPGLLYEETCWIDMDEYRVRGSTGLVSRSLGPEAFKHPMRVHAFYFDAEMAPGVEFISEAVERTVRERDAALTRVGELTRERDEVVRQRDDWRERCGKLGVELDAAIRERDELLIANQTQPPPPWAEAERAMVEALFQYHQRGPGDDYNILALKWRKALDTWLAARRAGEAAIDTGGTVETNICATESKGGTNVEPTTRPRRVSSRT